MSRRDPDAQAKVEKILADFDKSWVTYWDSYVTLQDQLYETIKAARDVAWLTATDPERLSEINRVQRELFATMPRRLDYMPLGQVAHDFDSAVNKLGELADALSAQQRICKEQEEAIQVLSEIVKRTREDLLAVKS